MTTPVIFTWSTKPATDTLSNNVLTCGVQGGPQWTLARVFAPAGPLRIEEEIEILRIEWQIETLQLVDGVMTLAPVNASPKTYAEATEIAERLVLDRLALLGFGFTGEAQRVIKQDQIVKAWRY